MPNKPILIMAGGTGGHVYPALAIADYLRHEGVALNWLGTKLGLEAQLVPAKGYRLHTINISGLRGKGLLRWTLSPVLVVIAVVQAMRVMVQIRPAAVLGMGGFVSGPGGLAAWLMRIPLCIHEQNAIAGLTNRILALLAARVLQAFPGTFPARRRAQTTGNPVRTDITHIPPPGDRLHLGCNESLRILVIGGSQGARSLNQVVPEALALIPRAMHLEIRHQTGMRFHREAAARYHACPHQVSLEPYIEEMAAAYGWADIVICRAGALTVAELAAAGVASILVPYPYAVDDHQTANARHLVNRGAAVLVPEKDLSAPALARQIQELYGARTRLLDMARQARAQSQPQATGAVARAFLELAYAG